MIKCKGTSKDTYSLGCGKPSSNRKLGLCMDNNKCYQKFLYGTEKGLKRIERLSIKTSKVRKEFEQAKQQKRNRSQLSAEIQKTQVIVNKYIRLRDKGKNCISQNIQWQKDFEAGHLYSKKTHSAIRFDYDNIHGQSIYGNRYLDGDFDNYLNRLPLRIGESRANKLKIRADECKRSVKKWTFEELYDIQEKTKLLIKEL